MAIESAAEKNAKVWQALYAAGRNDLRYPSEILVRLASRYLAGQPSQRVLDFGFGTGANLLHLAGLGHQLHGVEVSASAAERTQARLDAQGLHAQLNVIPAGSALPYEAGLFDVVVAWQVLYYNDLESWATTVRELERVARPGALVIVATAAPGDVSQLQAQALGQGLYRSQVTGQEGCMLTIPEREDLAELFPGRMLEIGEFAYSFGDVRARHWIITYRTP